jgi:hypothetical protein
MSCAQCGAVDQRGRFCVGCGKHLLPIPAMPRPVRLAPRALDETQPVLRFRVRPRAAVEDQPAAV